MSHLCTFPVRSSVAAGDEGQQQPGILNSSSVAAGERSYNYRVVMRSATGKELDMRGRCSAGKWFYNYKWNYLLYVHYLALKITSSNSPVLTFRRTPFLVVSYSRPGRASRLFLFPTCLFVDIIYSSPNREEICPFERIGCLVVHMERLMSLLFRFLVL